MKISLTPEAYEELYRLCSEMHATAGEFVSQLILNYGKHGAIETPNYNCTFCSLKYYSEDSLRKHLRYRHSDKMKVKK